MRVLVTRPEEDATDTAERLQVMGHSAVLSPLLKIRYRAGPPISLQGVQAVLATSANGVRALVARTEDRNVALFAVGPQTAEAARAAGFADVKTSDGDAEALAKSALQWATPRGGALLHAAAAETKGSVAEILRRTVTTSGRKTLYETVAPARLPDSSAKALADRAVDAVMLFSPRTASLFVALASAEGLAPACARIVAVCISAATAKALEPLQFREVRIAAKPNQDAVFACLG